MKGFIKLIVLLVCLCMPARASHIVGGNFELVMLDQATRRYELSLIMFFDKIGGNASSKDQNIKVGIFRKRDNALMQTVTLTLTVETIVTYANEDCAKTQGLKTDNYKYVNEIFLPESSYNDDLGYYIVWERCCRNSSQVNIVNPGNTGMTFYMQFPPVTSNNNSPVFNPINGEYICIDTDFKAMFDAFDKDGDQLVYRLSTPWRGNASRTSPAPQNPVGQSSYAEVSWASGFSASNSIPGSPALAINPQTGELTVKANQLGLFVFTIEVEEIRNGQTIGLIRRDFQLLVVDCSKDPPPKPIVNTPDTPPVLRDKGITSANLCDGGYAILETDNDAKFNYQWQKNGENLPDETKASIRITTAGKYSVLMTFAGKCSKESISETVTVKSTPSEVITILTDGSPTFCEGVKRELKASKIVSTYKFQWQRNGVNMAGETNPILYPNTSGKYTLLLRNQDEDCNFDPSQDVDVLSAPQALITNESKKNVICERDTIRLSANDGSNFKYQWLKNGQKIETSRNLAVIESGVYAVKVENGGACITESDTLNLTVNPIPKNVTLDSIPPFCDNVGKTVSLRGFPTGGVYAGTSVNNNQFDAKLAGAGRHKLTYTYTNEYQCKNTAVRWGSISSSPDIGLPNEVEIWIGSSIVLSPDKRIVRKDEYAYNWTPATGLDNARSPLPKAQPIQNTLYTVKATNSEGCESLATVNVKVYQGVFFPDLFTPNGDGINEFWDLKGSEYYSEMEVDIFDRWGIHIYHSKGYQSPFNGTFNGQILPSGAYAYTVQLSPDVPKRYGQLLIVR
jgi:gliding motility-associated-like protein